jgi:hypothetical protein
MYTYLIGNGHEVILYFAPRERTKGGIETVKAYIYPHWHFSCIKSSLTVTG